MSRIRLRAFSAHCANAGEHRSDFSTLAETFEEAAMLFVERWAGEGEACKIVVVESEGGERHCFTVQLGDRTPPSS